MFYVHIRVGAKRSLNVSSPTEYFVWRGEQGKNTSSAFQYHCILLHAMLLGVGEKNNGRFNIAGDVLSPFRVLQLFWNVKFDRCLCYRVARKIGLCCRPDLTKDLWEEVLCRVNTVSMTILPSQFKCDGNFVLPHLNSKKSDRCKVCIWYDSCAVVVYAKTFIIWLSCLYYLCKFLRVKLRIKW